MLNCALKSPPCVLIPSLLPSFPPLLLLFYKKEGGRKEGAREGKHLDQVVEIGTGVVTASLTGAGSVDGPRIFLEAGFGEIHVLSRAGRRAGGREGGRAGGVGLVPEGREQES
jgi:hypothetical protein